MSVRVVHGANEGYFSVEGMTVSQVDHKLRDVFNIPSNATALINGKDVDRRHVVANDDVVEFVRSDGRKGGVQEYWSASEVVELFGPDAIEEMRGCGITPVRITAYTVDQVTSFQAQRVGNPEPSRYGLIIDPGKYAVSFKDQGPLLLGNTISFHLLARLARRPNVYVEFRKLRDEVWKEETTEDATITRAISRLRKQLQEGEFTGITFESQRHAVRLKLV